MTTSTTNPKPQQGGTEANDVTPARVFALDPLPASSLIGRLTAEAQAARDAFRPGITFRESGKVTEVALPPDRVVEAVDRVSQRMGVYQAYVPGQPARARR